MTEQYLIWSHEHGAWRGPNGGYVQRVSQAGQYSRADAVSICASVIPGTSTRLGALPELPVPLADVGAMIAAYSVAFGDRPEPWLYVSGRRQQRQRRRPA